MKFHRFLNKEDVIKETDCFFDVFNFDGDDFSCWVPAAQFSDGKYVGKSLDKAIIRREITQEELEYMEKELDNE